eukprot:767506-Hanusia_phi.AAC.4
MPPSSEAWQSWRRLKAELQDEELMLAPYSPNKICAPKPGAQTTKRKWGDEKKFVVAARALQIDATRRGYESCEVCQVQNGRIVRICDVFGSSRSQAARNSDGSTWLPLRKIAQRSLKLASDPCAPGFKTSDVAVSLWQHLTGSEQGALIRVRSMEAIACASDSISTFRTSSDEVLLLVPPNHPKVKWELQNPKVRGECERARRAGAGGTGKRG